MRIAVPYENGNIFQHFGRSEAFKFYDVADGAVTAAAVVSTNGSGHGALAGFLMQRGVDTLICRWPMRSRLMMCSTSPRPASGFTAA